MTVQPLRDQRALVTGGSSGIGEAICHALAKAGAAVLVDYVGHADNAEAIAASIRDAGGRAVAMHGDVSKPEDCVRLFDAMDEHFGGVDILVANAGVQRDNSFAEMTLEQWRQVIDINLTGQFLCAQEAVRRFRRQGPRPDSPALGKVIFNNSVHQVIPWAGHANYAAAKGGLKLLMETMAQELAGEKIRVNAVAPGAIRTPINRAAWEDEANLQALLTKIPYGRIGEPADIARAVVWLASDEADYVVGATLFIDGGMTLYPEFREGG